jgi:hypothetical protein
MGKKFDTKSNEVKPLAPAPWTRFPSAPLRNSATFKKYLEI